MASLGLVHDLKSPVSVAASAFQVLEVLLGQADTETRFFRDTVRNSLRKVSDLVDGWQQVLVETGKDDHLQAVDLGSLVADVLAELGITGNRSDGTVSIAPLPIVRVERYKIRLVLRNLIENARTYCCDGVPLTLGIRSQRRGARYCISVRDNGRGIPARLRSTIFEPFRRVPGSPGTGLGLGLSLVKRIVEQHGGSVWIHSRIGVGTTVFFTLPSTE